MDFNHRHLGPALGAQWTFAFCKLLILKDWSGRMDLNHRPPGPEPGALARLRYAPTVTLGCIVATQAGLSDYHSSALPGYRRVAVHFSSKPSPHSSRNLLSILRSHRNVSGSSMKLPAQKNRREACASRRPLESKR